MKALVDAGAKASVKAADGTTVALAAAGSGNLDAVKYALKLDPNLNALARVKNVMHMALANRTAPRATRKPLLPIWPTKARRWPSRTSTTSHRATTSTGWGRRESVFSISSCSSIAA